MYGSGGTPLSLLNCWAISYSCTVLSSAPEPSSVPSLEKDTWLMKLVLCEARVCTLTPEYTSHSRTVPSLAHDASRLPSTLKATLSTAAVWPVSTARHSCAETSHTRICAAAGGGFQHFSSIPGMSPVHGRKAADQRYTFLIQREQRKRFTRSPSGRMIHWQAVSHRGSRPLTRPRSCVRPAGPGGTSSRCPTE